jgi:TRAP-type C4-dicarboxylate transport system permease small subunit
VDYFRNISRCIGGGTVAVSGGLLLATMALVVANIVSRLFGPAILGSFELSSFMMIMVIGFALVYTTMERGHTVVKIVVSRFSKRAQAIAESFVLLIGASMWGLLTYGTLEYYLSRGLQDRTDVLEIPLLPVRCVWGFTLLIFTLMLLIYSYKSLVQVGKK